ncbi:CapA family protein [Occallatibacter savannae]|uniref:CapA family protein n=1 Tax=Occallatibacter savannae TaxID=1002691 RepID=UPI0013A5399F|nr:CapA family protein [Occallatibacter savannae]
MNRTAKWKSGGEGFPPVPESKATAWLGLSPQAAALAVITLLVLVMAGAYVSRLTERLHGAAAAPTPYPHELAKVSFAVAGDVIPHEPVRASAEAAGGGVQGWGSLFSDVDDVFKGVDFGFVNLETPVAPAHSKGSKPFMFDAPPALPQALKENGIKIVSFANNHVMDQGWAGFAETRDHLKEIGLQFAGSGDTAGQSWEPLVVEANGIKVGWLGMTRWLNGNRNPDKDDQPHVNFFPYPGEGGGAPGADETRVLEAVKSAKTKCDLLVISVHWGTEYATAPRPEDVELAHKMLDAGAGLIVGHHPHVLQPIETYTTADGRMAVIFYSLGNFLSNQSRNYVDGLMPDKDGDPRDSMIGLFSAVKNDYGPAGVKVELGHVGMLPAWGENNRNAIAAGKTKTPSIHPVLIDREIPKAQAQLAELNKAADGRDMSAEQKQQFIDLNKELKVLMDRRSQILARTGDEYLMDPPKLPSKP